MRGWRMLEIEKCETQGVEESHRLTHFEIRWQLGLSGCHSPHRLSLADHLNGVKTRAALLADSTLET